MCVKTGGERRELFDPLRQLLLNRARLREQRLAVGGQIAGSGKRHGAGHAEAGRTHYQFPQRFQVGRVGRGKCCLEIIRVCGATTARRRRAFFQLDNIHAGTRRFAPAGFKSSASIPRAPVISLRAVRNNSLNSPYPSSSGRPFRFAAGIDSQQRTGRKAVRPAHDRIQDALFDLRLLSAFSAFNGVDEIERRQAQLVEAQFFRLQTCPVAGSSRSTMQRTLAGIAEQFRRPGVQMWLGVGAKRFAAAPIRAGAPDRR